MNENDENKDNHEFCLLIKLGLGIIMTPALFATYIVCGGHGGSGALGLILILSIMFLPLTGWIALPLLGAGWIYEKINNE